MTNNIKKSIQKHISKIVQNIAINIKDNIITVTNIDIANDLSKSNIYVSILKNKENIIKQLNNSSKEIKHSLTTKMKKYKIPAIHFLIDKSLENERKITKLLQKKNDSTQNNFIEQTNKNNIE